jgi:methionine biosynthesis protein MetW
MIFTPSQNLIRSDWNILESFITPHAKVLDLGCGDGSLLELLRDKKKILARGVDINPVNILSCIQKGLSVFQSDLDEGLSDYGDKAFDFVILSLTLQVVYTPKMLLKELLRVGKKAIVSIPNFGHWSLRSRMFFFGQSIKSKHLPYEWYDTPNIRVITVKDFMSLCDHMNIKIEALGHTTLSRTAIESFFAKRMPNLFSQVSVFLLS